VSYAFPRDRGPQHADDVRGRTAHVGARLRELDPDRAHEARSTAPPAPPARRGRRRGPAAAPSGRTNLWLPIGPGTVLSGQASGRPRVMGRIRAIAVHPLGERVYAAAADGGVWYSGDGGASWLGIGGFAPTPGLLVPRVAHRHSCGAVVVDFAPTADLDEVFVGTGEPVAAGGLPGGSRRGLGVLSAVGPATAAVTADPWQLEGRSQLEGAGIHRIARRPGGGAFLVAATNGLWQRGAGALDPYTRATGAPFATFAGEVTDVLWCAAGGGVPQRVWAYVQEGARRGLWFRDDGDVDWTRVFTPNAAGRGKLAATDPATTVYLMRDLRADEDNSLRRFDATADPVTSVLVTGVPNAVHDQGFYDMALAVDPSDPRRVALGGSGLRTLDPVGTAAEFDAAIWTGTVPAGAAPAFTGGTHIGIGVHADVHDLVYSNGGARLWAACDGGLYRSDDPARVAGFRAVNDRRPVIEPNYLAVHPQLEGFVVAGLQDNGTIERASGAVWRNRDGSDGGGVVLRPDSPDAIVHQFFAGQWTPIDPLDRAVNVGNTQPEIDASAFYSAPAAGLHTRPGAPPVTVGQILIGTTRVWMTQDFGASWATLPTGTDAGQPAHLPAQDRLRSAVLACRWQGEDEAWVLCRNEVYLFSRTPGTDTAASVGTWARHLELQRTFPSPAGSARALVKRSPTWTDLAVDPDVGGARRGARGAFYLGTTGRVDDPAVDTLYWFDGDLTLHATGLRTEAGGVPAPVTAIAPDPSAPGTVYVGTSVGVWRGVRTVAAGVPDWAWSPLVNGLPEAPVEDLSVFDDGGVRLLRAAVNARGVWELRLGADAQDLTYLRVHEDDMRHRATSVLVNRNLVGTRSWHASPDVRPRAVTSAVTPPTAAAPWTFLAQPPPAQLRRFQAACRSRFADLRFRSSGLWDRYFDEVLRDNGAPVVAGTVTVDPVFFAGVMLPAHRDADPWPAAIPTEADLHDYLPPLPEGAIGAASTPVPPAPHRVDVVVHRRGLDPVAGADVRVALLRWSDPFRVVWARARPSDPATWPTGPVPWTAAANEVLDGTGVPSSSTGLGWSFVGTTAATRRRSPAGTLDDLTSGVVTFDLDLTGEALDTVVLLVAVLRADGPAALAPAPLRDLTLGNPHVAVRSLRVTV
jgi:hypothetical protein